MTKLTSSRVGKIPSANVRADRYQFIELSETEPDLGLPSELGQIFTSDLSGNRRWTRLDTANVSESSSALYYTNSRTVSAVTPILTTANVVENPANLYFTNDRVTANVANLSIGILFDVDLGANLTTGKALVYDSNVNAFVPVFVNSEIANVADLAVRVISLENQSTANVREASSNLYFTNTRVLDAISLATINPDNINARTIVTDSITSNIWNNLYTSNIVELNNLFYTNSRAVSAVVPLLTTANVVESESNLYFTNTRVVDAISLRDINPYNVTVNGNISITGNATATGIFANYIRTDNLRSIIADFDELIVNGNTTFYGDVTTYGANDLVISDNMVYINHGGNTAANPDLGFVWAFNPEGAEPYQHGGMFRDASDGIIKFFQHYTIEPDSNIFLELNNGISGFEFANIQAASFIGNVVGVVSSLSNHTTDALAEGQVNLYYTNARVVQTVTPLLTTANVSELNNQYFTNVRVLQAVNPVLTTANVVELDNLYFTNARVLSNVEQMSINVLADVDISGIGVNSTLVWDGTKFIPGSTEIALRSNFANTAGSANVAGVANVALLADSANIVLSLDNHTTSNLREGSNLYFTDGRAIAAVTPLLTTGNVVETTNQYFTNTRVLLALAGSNVSLDNLTVAGDLVVQGNTVTLNTAVLTIEDKNITLANGAINAAAADGAGFYIQGANANLTYVSAGDKFVLNKNLDVNGNAVITGDIISSGNLIANGLIIRGIFVLDNVLTGNVTAAATTSANITADRITANTWINLYSGNVVETTNLFFTNARAVTAVTPVLTTANVRELSSNLYFTTARARAAFTEGFGIAISANGVISTRGNDTGLGLFNSGINLQGNALAQATFANVETFIASEGNSFIAFSLIATNLSDNVSYLTGRTITDGNINLFANLLEIPKGGSVELFRKPQVFKVGDSVQVQGFNQFLTPQSNLISTYLSFQGSTDDTFQRSAVTLTNNTLVPVFQTINRTSIVESINLVNLSPSIIPTTVTLTNSAGAVQATLVSNLAIPAYSSVEICEYPKTLSDDFFIRAQKFDNNLGSVAVYTSSKYTSSFTVAADTSVITESGSVIFNITTTNLIDGTQLWYETQSVSGNVTASDFVTANTGLLTITNGSAILTLQANADLNSNYEGDEIFRLVIRRGSSTGAIVATTGNIRLADTSNVVVYNSIVEVDNTIAEGTSASFVITTTNLGPNNTLYYSTVGGNATSSDFVTGNTGSFITTGNAYTLSIATNSNIPAGETRNFQLQIRTGSTTGPVQLTSNSITIVDALQAFVTATGGFVTIEDGYKVHHFTTSNTFSISGLGIAPNRNLEYFIVAGGGGGSPVPPGAQGGGGGAGGVLAGNVTLTSTGNYVALIGGGGASNGPAYNGSNSNVTLAGVLNLVGVGGGRAGLTTIGGTPGGSGGGGGTNSAGATAGNSWGTQGNPGGSGPVSGNGGGGGGGGAGQPGFPATWPNGNQLGAGGNGIGRSWIFASYGTPDIDGGGVPPTWVASRQRMFGGGGGAFAGYGSPNPPDSRAIGWYGIGGGGGTRFTPGSPRLLGRVDGLTNTGGGGSGYDGGINSYGGGNGGSGFIALRYPYTIQTINLNDGLSGFNSTFDNSNINYTVTTVNVSNLSVLYWTMSGNVLAGDVVGGNTGSFTVVNANASFVVSLANNIVSGADTKEFALQLRTGSVTGSIITTANSIIIYNSNDPGTFMSATGGNVTISGGFKTHTFTESNSFVVSSTGRLGGTVQSLIVAGGGGGGRSGGNGGGGGGGGYWDNVLTLSNVTYTITVGGGGAGGNGTNPAFMGGNSSIVGGVIDRLAIGGGRGSGNPGNGGGPGGSGGGGGSDGTSGGTAYYSSGFQGYPGRDLTPLGYAGGGGGAGGQGDAFYANGGPGKQWLNGVYYAGGGGGGNPNAYSPTAAQGGIGGGGNGAPGSPTNVGARSGNVNTGGGGGGNSSGGTGASGGSGIVIIRYPFK